MPTVPNRFPKFPDGTGRRLALIGEAPGADEELCGEPFVGSSGKLLKLVVEQSGAIWDSVFLGNICQTRPPGNDIEEFAWDGPEITAGLSQLKIDLDLFKPTCVLALGRTAFRYFKPDKCYEDKKGIHIPLQDWRGSIFDSVVTGHKVIATFHPAYINRVIGDIPYFRLDISRAVRHSLPGTARTSVTRTGTLRPSLSDVVSFLQLLRSTRLPASIDIEGYTDALGITMFGIAPTRETGLVIPFQIDGRRYWNEDDEAVVWKHLADYLADPLCPKCCHNAFYETVVCGWRHQLVIAGRVDDTMMLQWEAFPELEKSLGVTASIWTEEPYYKDERESSGDTKLGYNFKDCAVTQECVEEIPKRLNPLQLDHYHFNISLIPAFTYMQLRGCRLDVARVAQHRLEAEKELATLTEKLDAATSIYLGHSFNAKSLDDKAWFLYDFLGYEPSKRWGRSTKEELLHRYYVKHRNELVKILIQAVAKRTRISDLGRLLPSADGRIRSAYGLVDTVTGRINSRESSIVELLHDEKGRPYWEHTGTNLQNITKAIRDCFISDGDEYDFFEADLEGADAWTVAADLAALGAPAMLNDLIAHIKPSKVLLLMLDALEAHTDPALIARMEPATLKPLVDAIDVPEGVLPDGRPASWKYISMKRVQHGCVIGGHEVLTKNGWIKIEDLKSDVQILSWNIEGSAQFEVPSHLTSYLYTGNLHSFQGTAFDLTVTHDHRMPLENGGPYKVKTAEQLAAEPRGHLPVSALSYSGSLVPYEFIRLLAAYQSDGCRGDVLGNLQFHFVKGRKVERLQMICKELNVPFSLYECADGTVQCTVKELKIYNFGKSTDWRLLGLSSESMKTYLEETVHWDGSIDEKYCHKRTEITTSVLLRAEVMHTMAHLCGLGSQLTRDARISGFGTSMHSVSLNQRSRSTAASLVISKEAVIDVPVYCVTVSTGFFFVRRNDKIMITGNTNYDGKEDTISATIFKDSDGVIDIPPQQIAVYQMLYRLRYNTSLRTEWIRRELGKTGVLKTATGFQRRFFGIRNPRAIDDSIIREAAATEPQQITTHVINRCIRNLWFDERNRRRTGALFVEPLLQIHDALAGQFPSRLRPFAAEQLHVWFANPLTIHGIPITIPYEGKFGRSWGECKNQLT
jgi:uracil-DNA glycosylase family 4